MTTEPKARLDEKYGPKQWTIYGVLSRAGEVVYVGIAVDVAKRLRTHLIEADGYRENGRAPSPFGQWMQEYVAENDEPPQAITLDTIYGLRRDAEERERIQIAAHFARGCALLNVIGDPRPVSDLETPPPGFRARRKPTKKAGATGKRQVVNFRLHPDVLAQLDAVTAEGNPSRSQAIEQAIQAWVVSKRNA